MINWRSRRDEGGKSLIVAVGPRMRCLNNDETLITWSAIGCTIWVGKKLFSAYLVISPKCVLCGDMARLIAHVLFHCPVVWFLCKLLEGYIFRVLHGNSSNTRLKLRQRLFSFEFAKRWVNIARFSREKNTKRMFFLEMRGWQKILVTLRTQR